MKDNIATGAILNRKIVIEIRFNPMPKILDIKGLIIKSIEDLDLFPVFHWEVGDAVVSVKDNNEQANVRNQMIVEINRFAFISSKIDSIESFYAKFYKIYSKLDDLFSFNEYRRIGCRIQGTYKVKSYKFDDILKNFKESFPNEIFLKDFPVKDIMFRMNYSNGMYIIGPIQENDEFLKKEFPFHERNNSIGVGIDTDNYYLNESGETIKASKIKDVFTASLAVEKSLYENLKNF